jgi:hypothetical protein
MTPYVASGDITGDLTVLELLEYFRLGTKSVGKATEFQWFDFHYMYYDGLHISLTLFGFYLYSHY